MNKKEREEIYKAINDVSNKVNDISQKQDEIMQMLNRKANEKISVNAGGIDDLGSAVTAHDEAIDELATMITSLESEE